jgi:hypothetical protein
MPDMKDDNVHGMWSEDDLDRALSALHPAEDLDHRAFQRLRAELVAAAGGPASSPAPRRRRGKWLAAVGTVAAAVASLLVVQTVQLDDTIPSAAAEQLNRAAARITAVDEPLGPGQYRYIATRAWWMTNDAKGHFLAENLLETWVPADRTQEWLWRRDVTGARKYLDGTVTEARPGTRDSTWPEGEWRARCGDWFGSDNGTEACARAGDWSMPTPGFLASLPRDPDELYDRLRRDTAGRGSDPDLEMVVYVADALRSGLVPADLRAALYRALAKVPELEITEELANVDGRKGTAYGVSAKGTRHDVIVDPATGQFIGEREITEEAMDTGIPEGTVLSYTSVTTAVVSEIGVRPAG